MLNITPFGWFHTAISLVSLFGGLYALLRHHDIRYATPLGKTYTWFTVATCLTSFFLMRTGKLSEAHGLTVLTLIVLANTEALWWGNSLARAEIQRSPVAAAFLEAFVEAPPAGEAVRPAG